MKKDEKSVMCYATPVSSATALPAAKTETKSDSKKETTAAVAASGKETGVSKKDSAASKKESGVSKTSDRKPKSDRTKTSTEEADKAGASKNDEKVC